MGKNRNARVRKEVLAEISDEWKDGRRVSAKEQDEDKAALPVKWSAKPTQAERARRQMEVANYYVKGLPQAIISEKMGLSLPTIKKDIDAVIEMWRQKAIMDMDQRKAEELARLDWVESQAMEAWERSKTPLSTSVERYEDQRAVEDDDPDLADDPDYKRIRKKGGKPTFIPYKRVKETKTKESAGDPRFLEEVTKCVQLRLKILGLLDKDTGNVTQIQINWGDMYVSSDPGPDPLEEKLKTLPKMVDIIENTTPSRDSE